MKEQYKCVGREKEYAREYYQKNKEHVRALNGVSQRHPRRLQYQREWRTNLKIDVLTHYGDGRCSCAKCGEARLPCLSIDHINGAGTLHRRKLGLIGLAFYSWLRRNDYPDGYQVLCMNCQFVKRAERGEWRKAGG